MTSTPGSPTPTWYDVLGVSRDASSAEIKSAWRDATDKFEPGSGSGQFRMFNDAADVLLDPTRRAAYDATLDDAQLATVEELSPDPDPDQQGSLPTAVSVVSRPDGRDDRSDASTRVLEPASRTLGLLTLVLALLTVAAVVGAVVLGLKVRTDAQVTDARAEAPAAAERAAAAMLSYDYKDLPGDRKRASGYLTEKFRKIYLKNFMQLEKQKDGTPGLAVQTKTVVTSSVLGSGVMDAEQNVVRVLIYVNQVSKKADADPQIFQNRVTMKMEKSGNRWLVADLKSY